MINCPLSMVAPESSVIREMSSPASNSMFYPLTMCALQIVFMTMIMLQHTMGHSITRVPSVKKQQSYDHARPVWFTFLNLKLLIYLRNSKTLRDIMPIVEMKLGGKNPSLTGPKVWAAYLV